MFERFLNNELPSLIKPPSLRSGERFHSRQDMTICTLFGPIKLTRDYYRGPRGGRFPLDETLALHRHYTPAVAQLMCWAGAMDSSYEHAEETFRRFTGLTIPGRQIQRIVNDLATRAVAWMRSRSPDTLPQPPAILNIQADMTGIPARPEDLVGIKGKQPDGSAKSRQIKIGCVFTQTKGINGAPERDPFSTTYAAAFCDHVDFGSLLRSEALKRGYAAAKTIVFIGDGAEWIWNMVAGFFKDAVQIVDFYHACEHLFQLCHTLEPDEIRAKTLFKKWRRFLKLDRLPRIMHEAYQRAEDANAETRQQILDQLRYFRNNAARMTYKTFRQKGFFIGSGVVEGSCRHLVAQRTKLSGMRWHCLGAEHVLAFRAIIKSRLFDAYCTSIHSIAA